MTISLSSSIARNKVTKQSMVPVMDCFVGLPAFSVATSPGGEVIYYSVGARREKPVKTGTC
jgi:hypothetical protein